MARPGQRLIRARFDSPIGRMILVSRGAALVAADFDDCESRLLAGLRRHFPRDEVVDGDVPGGVRSGLGRYYDGDIAALAGVPVALSGTAFQRVVWNALRAIPPGITITYTELARRAGRPRAIRAAGHANGSNPVSVVVPCHRVIGIGGSLTGYAGGLARKRWLLAHEGALQN